MESITQVNQLSFHQNLGNDQAFIIKLAGNKLDNAVGSDLFGKVETWIMANSMMSSKEIPTLIVDMENVEFIDSQGLQKLLSTLHLIQSQQSNLLLCSLQASVRLVFEISRMDQVFGIFPSFDNCVNHIDFPHRASNYPLAA
jgi:anti-anti-sigma factor